MLKRKNQKSAYQITGEHGAYIVVIEHLKIRLTVAHALAQLLSNQKKTKKANSNLQTGTASIMPFIILQATTQATEQKQNGS